MCGESGRLDRLYRDLKTGVIEGSQASRPLRIGGDPSKSKEDTSPALLKRLNEGQRQTGTEDAHMGRGVDGRGRGLKWQEDTSSALLKRLNCGQSSHAKREYLSRWFEDNYTPLRDAPRGRVAQEAFKRLNERGVDPARIDVGLLSSCPGRVVFPFRQGGDVVYYQARSLYNMPLKTVNPDTEIGWLPKTAVLYNFDEILMCEREVVLTEGIFDAYSAGTTLDMRYTCLLGTTISSEQIRMLKLCDIKDILVFLDSDANSAAVKLGIRLWENKFRVRVVLWTDALTGEKLDPNDISPALLKMLATKFAVRIDHTASTELSLLYG